MSRIPENAINQVKTKRLQILNHEEMTFRQDLVVEIQGFKLFVEKFFYVTLKKMSITSSISLEAEKFVTKHSQLKRSIQKLMLAR